MTDPWVTNTQNWLNNTYTGVSGWNPVTVTGRTGWATMYALTRALQHELGISSLSDNFGSGTFAAVNAISPINNSTSNKNIIRIIQGAMFCKGYNGGDGQLDGVYSAITIAGVKQLQTDIGLGAGNGDMTAKVLKALLNMDAYVLVAGGSAPIRTIQRDLNARYVTRRDFYLIPADGFFSRSVQNALLFALQYEIGMADGVANGSFGPGTQQGLKDKANYAQGASDASTGKYFVHLFQAALTFNGYPATYDGAFSSVTTTVVQSFQSFCALPVTGRSDFQTWASLLVSTGDTLRPGTAADCITTITAERAQTLVAAGYQTVGRYLTNSPVADPLNKNIKQGELETIFSHGLTVFPIFQEGGDGLSYFNYAKGLYAGGKADQAARQYGFKAGTTIYFAVDFDALGEEVYSNVVPYFRGITQAMGLRGDLYRIGIYGARNTCIIVSEEGLASLSFVSGMSTGYSGNLGFPLPSNWAFDQILEYTIGSGAGALGIDKDIKSGRDLGQSSVDPTPTPPAVNSEFFTGLYWLQQKAEQYAAAHPGSRPGDELAMQYLRGNEYADGKWTLFLGERDAQFLSFVDAEALADKMAVLRGYTDPENGLVIDDVDGAHLFATINGYLFRPLPGPDEPKIVDLGGWAGDLVTTLADYVSHSNADETLEEFGLRTIGAAPNTQNDYQFDRIDFIQDLDALNVVSAYRNFSSRSLVDHIRDALSPGTGGSTRYSQFFTHRFGDSSASANQCTGWVFTLPDDNPERLAFIGGRAALLHSYNSGVAVGDFPTADLEALGRVFFTKLTAFGNFA